jgi:hypothetical protein
VIVQPHVTPVREVRNDRASADTFEQRNDTIPSPRTMPSPRHQDKRAHNCTIFLIGIIAVLDAGLGARRIEGSAPITDATCPTVPARDGTPCDGTVPVTDAPRPAGPVRNGTPRDSLC